MGMAFAGTIALAHTGASGVVLERMNGMTALRDAMRDLTPIVQGVAPYDMETVSQAGDVIAAHSGETMRALFPEDSIFGVTYAKPNIWSDWEEFASLADDLRAYGETLTNVAPNGLQPVAMAMPMASTAEAGPGSALLDDRAVKIANLMGFTAPSRRATNMPAAAPETLVASTMTTELGPEEIFAKITGTCSACHAKFRTGRN